MSDRSAKPLRGTLKALLLLAVIAGCSGPAVVPVSDLTAARTTDSIRVVRPGDSLYTIAWEAGLDYRDVALWNGLEPPYRLKAGQKLSLGGDLAGAQGRSVTRAVVEPEVVPVVTENTVVQTQGIQSSTASQQASEPATLTDPTSTTGPWTWPANGELISRFDPDGGNNGIDIAGSDGSPVRAAAKGKVVYAGTGLRGYGLLIIIKHDETFLSAYAHNRAVTINEGDPVHSGQIIAQMGQSGTDTVRLHFEIRRDGQPVDPLRYLPKL
jgi:lipoprotein NlpD